MAPDLFTSTCIQQTLKAKDKEDGFAVKSYTTAGLYMRLNTSKPTEGGHRSRVGIVTLQGPDDTDADVPVRLFGGVVYFQAGREIRIPAENPACA